MAIVLSKLDTMTKSEEGVFFDIFYEGSASGIQIKLKGPDSKVFKQNAIALRKYITKQKEKNADINQDEADEKMIQLFAALTVDWQFVKDDGTVLEHKLLLDEEGNELDYNLENAVTLYTNFPFVTKQVGAYVEDSTNFLQG